MFRNGYYKKKKVRIPESPDEAYKNALKTAMNIVGYKDNTERTLAEKLLDRGYSEETVFSVVSFMKEKGYVDDRRMLVASVRSMANSKLYGKARIKNELAIKKFAREALASLDWDSDELSDIDFSQVCLKLLKKRGGTKDEKTYAFLRRYGHSSSDIRAAYSMLSEERENEEIEEENI